MDMSFETVLWFLIPESMLKQYQRIGRFTQQQIDTLYKRVDHFAPEQWGDCIFIIKEIEKSYL